MRIQEDKLTIKDLTRYPVWEYALDEEGLPGQDEKTLKPCAKLPGIEDDVIYLIVRASFILANEVAMTGFINPSDLRVNKMMSPLLPYDLHPVIVTGSGHVHFCFGNTKPDRMTMTESYRRLGYEAKNVFPIEFKADVIIPRAIVEGLLEGFLYIEQGSKSTFHLEPSDLRFVT